MTQYDWNPIQNTNPSNPAILYNPYVEMVEQIDITILNTTDTTFTPTKVQLGIFGCGNPQNIVTKAQLESVPTRASYTMTETTRLTPTIAGATSSATTTKRCEEMQAVDEAVSKQITVTPTELPKEENIEFQPTSTRGVSFPKEDQTPTITVNFGKPAEVQSVTIPRDKTPNANVQQFEVTFYSPDGKKINNKPILTNSSPKDDKTKPAQLDSTQTPSNTPVSRIEITIVQTTDGESPKGVVLDIKACTEATTG
jgi:hypothetical protein